MMIGFVMLMAAVAAPHPAATAQAEVPPAIAAGASEPLRHDRKGRPTMPVRINGAGPFDMIVDTGAQSSLVTPTLAADLKLPVLQGGMVVNGATGATTASLYGVDRLSSRLFDVSDVAMTALASESVTDARGIIGMDNFADRKLTFDRQGGVVTATPSGPPPPGFVALKGRVTEDGFLIVPITVNGRSIDALVDSGAEGTIAGPALIDLLGWAPDDARLKARGTIRGTSGRSDAVRSATMDAITIGPVRFSNVPVTITAQAGAGDDHGIILGSDLLNLLMAYAVDVKRQELQVRVPSAAGAPVSFRAGDSAPGIGGRPRTGRGPDPRGHSGQPPYVEGDIGNR